MVIAKQQAIAQETKTVITVFRVFELKKKYKHWFFLVFLLDFGPGQLTSFHFILSYEAGFYEPTVLKLHPPICMITQHIQHYQVTFPQF
jgi:hypothetical protein